MTHGLPHACQGGYISRLLIDERDLYDTGHCHRFRVSLLDRRPIWTGALKRCVVARELDPEGLDVTLLRLGITAGHVYGPLRREHVACETNLGTGAYIPVRRV